MEFTNNLKKIRMEKGLTQRQAASLLGLHCEGRLSQWERGTSLPSAVNLLRMARVYGVRCEDLFPAEESWSGL